MRLITRSGKAAAVAEAWRRQYQDRDGSWKYDTHPSFTTGLSKEQTYNALVILGPNPNADDVDRVIGNTSWTACRCDECDQYFEEVMEVGQDPEYESSTAELCEGCVIMALNSFDPQYRSK